jgi:hypothetical protein
MKLADLVRAVVDQEQPENIDPAAITLTGEGPEVEIVIVPHRDLDGVSLVVWTDRRGARLLWADVGDLSTHDELDLGVVVESIAYEGDWRARLQDAIAAEFRRPIRLKSRTRWFGGPRVECSIVIGGRDRRIGVVGLPKDQDPGRKQSPTSLNGGTPP